ncbi:hypothetical protein V1477_016631 [Vespula maculifrons]|uniref:Uncharacterized protein n=1 Tax=Vespula maculifrons TaxID=7453 RepID=A0ABD2B8Y2_VESMC
MLGRFCCDNLSWRSWISLLCGILLKAFSRVLHSLPQSFSAHTYVLNSIEMFNFGRCKDREIFEYSINIFSNSKSDIVGKCGLDHVSEFVPVDEKSLIVSIEDTSSPQVLLSRIPMIFLITRPFAIINLELQSICLQFSVQSRWWKCIMIIYQVSTKCACFMLVQGYLLKEAYRGCAMELMGPFVFPGFGH